MEQLCENIYFIEGEKGGKFPYSNSLLIMGDKDYLIDSGAGKKIKKLEPDLVLNSHWHNDHIAANSKFVNSKIAAHKLDAGAIESKNEFMRRYDLPNKFERDFSWFDFRRVNQKIEEGHKFTSNDIEIKIIHAPGHTLGHTCFLIDGEKNIVFLSDIDLSSFGPWYGGMDSNIESFLGSIDKLIELIKEKNIEIAVSSHKSPIEKKIPEKLEEYKQKIFDREKLIKNKSPAKAEDLVGKGIFYREFPEPKDVFRFFEKVMIEKHLSRLTQ